MATSMQTDFPKLPDAQSVTYVAITTFVLAYSFWIPVYPILLLYALWFSVLIYAGKFTLRPGRDLILPGALSLLCLASSFWADVPLAVIYPAFQYISTIMCAMIISRLVTLDNFIKGLSIGAFFVLLILFRKGHYDMSGLFGSKNQVGLFAQIGLICSTVLFFTIKTMSFRKVIFCFLPFMLSVLCLLISFSVSSIISTFVILCMIAVVYFLMSLPKSMRLILISMSLMCLSTLAMVIYAFDLDPYGDLLQAFGKDKSLTGRTDLWGYGTSFALENSWLGTGFSRFWFVGHPLAEQIWQEFHIPGKAGFHFHNVFIQAMVELGYIGLVLMTVIILTPITYALRHVLYDDKPSLLVVFTAGLAVMFIMRSMVEVDVFNPYTIGTIILFYIVGQITQAPNKH